MFFRSQKCFSKLQKYSEFFFSMFCPLYSRMNDHSIGFKIKNLIQFWFKGSKFFPKQRAVIIFTRFMSEFSLNIINLFKIWSFSTALSQFFPEEYSIQCPEIVHLNVSQSKLQETLLWTYMYLKSSILPLMKVMKSLSCCK